MIRCLILVASVMTGLMPTAHAQAPAVVPETVYFQSGDRSTELVGYLFRPQTTGPHPAVVMLHGRGGPYSSAVKANCQEVRRSVASACDAWSLAGRHHMWGEYWVRHGYAALLVDSFGPRGKAHGFARHTHGSAEREPLNERTVRPLDAEGALAWLVQQPDIQADRVMLQGWSHGGSTVLNAVYRQARQAPAAEPRFRAALSFYPGCGPQALLGPTLRSDIPLMILVAADDEEVSPQACRAAANSSPAAVELRWYEGATHGFDDPAKQKQKYLGNRMAWSDALRRAARFFDAAP